MEVPCVGGKKCCSEHMGHMTKMTVKYKSLEVQRLELFPKIFFPKTAWPVAVRFHVDGTCVSLKKFVEDLLVT